MWRGKVVLALALVLFCISSKATVNGKNYSEEVLDSLHNLYGNNKTFDSAMYAPALLALAYYPELADAEIEYRHKKLPTLMAARPAIDFVFRKKNNRKYIIFISNNHENHSCQVFKNMTLSSKTGILGHEYAHLVEYQKLSNIQMAWYAVKYILKRKEIERETDRETIARGLGREILDYTVHIKTSKLTSKKYLERKKKYYLSVTEIRQLVHPKIPARIVKNY